MVCVELNTRRVGGINISASLVCALNVGTKKIYLISAEGWNLSSDEGYKLYTETLKEE